LRAVKARLRTALSAVHGSHAYSVRITHHPVAAHLVNRGQDLYSNAVLGTRKDCFSTTESMM